MNDIECIDWYDYIYPFLWGAYKGDRIDYDFCKEYNTKKTKNIRWFKGTAMIDKDRKRYTCRCGYMTISKGVPTKCPNCRLRKWHEEDMVIFKAIPISKEEKKSVLKENLILDDDSK